VKRAALVALVLLVASCGGGMPSSLRHPLAGARAPSLGSAAEPPSVGLPGADASPRVTVVDFWASWCGGCQDSLPQLEALWRDRRGSGLRVLGVSVDERAEHAYAMAAALHTTFPVVVDDGRLAASFRVAQVPLTFVIDGAGTVRWVGREPDEVRRAVEAVLAE
jgi:cytochrome c biogenesis protein CcmG/thiol:disulfide interchange protein DsbE